MTRGDCEQLRCDLDITIKVILIVCFAFLIGAVVGVCCRPNPPKIEAHR